MLVANQNDTKDLINKMTAVNSGSVSMLQKALETMREETRMRGRIDEDEKKKKKRMTGTRDKDERKKRQGGEEDDTRMR